MNRRVSCCSRLPRRIVFAAMVVAGLGAAAGGGSETDWPQFLGPRRDGASAGDDLAERWPAAGPPVLWQKEVGAGFAGPVVASGKLVLFHRLDDRETVDCLDADTGERRWRSDYPATYQDDFGFDPGPRATPTIDAGRIYTYGADGMLHCWELATGARVWHVDTKAEYQTEKGFFGRACSPLVAGEGVILNIGGAGGAGIVALNKRDGTLLWKATDHEASYSSPVVAAPGGKRSVLVFTREGLVALEPGTGRIDLEFPFRSPMHASVNAATPLVVGDDVFLSASYGTGAVLLKLDQPEPKKVWASDRSLSNHYATSVHHAGFLYGFHGRQEQTPSFRCVELMTGKVRWSEDDFGAGVVLLAGEKLLVLTEKGQILVAPATPAGFAPTARAQVLPFDTRAYPALASGRLYARSAKKLVCLDLQTKSSR